MSSVCQLLASGDLILLPEVEVPRKVCKSFEESVAAGLLSLATDALEEESLPTELAYWREFGREFLTRLCQTPPDREEGRWIPLEPPPGEWLAERISAAPPFPGLENLSPELLARYWAELDRLVCESVRTEGGGLEAWLHHRHPVWRSVGRVTFHLAENKRSDSHPFAFLATYTHKVSAQAKLQYLPVAKALKTYGNQKNTRVLQSLLKPIYQAAQTSDLARELLESRRVFQVLAWTPPEAYRFIRDIDAFERAGLIVKVPDWWKGGRPARPTVNVNLDTRETTSVGLNALLKFNVALALDGETLTPEEWEQIRNAQGGLISIKGKWVEVDPEKLRQVLEHWRKAERAAASGGLSFLEGMRLLAGFRGLGGTGSAELDAALESGGSWVNICASGELRERLKELRDPRRSPDVVLPPQALRASLRPYQQAGVNWLWHTYFLGLGACLADDMGLGKTIQVIALLLRIQQARQESATLSPKSRPSVPASAGPSSPSLLVVPASLIGNWRKEIEKFAPGLRVCYAHPSQTSPLPPLSGLSGYDAIITTYSMLRRLPELTQESWNLLVLDEAQAIKNPGSQQSKTVKSLSSRRRLALTGTPIENNITDLWSLFDFLNPGLLGSANRFSVAVKALSQDAVHGFQPLRQLVAPYILRRLKSDRSIISDLPDKVEMRTDCGLSKDQATLYQKSVRELAVQLREQSDDSIERKGLVLTYLMRFKQICDHPALWTGSGNFDPKSSGKFNRLAELADVMHQRGEKVLVFTQFREMTAPLAGHLEVTFGRSGLVLHGGTPVSRRQKLVEQFQDPAGPPFFVISLKAGGTGLNLTAASHVIHFDRWWNPAVEDQATDRAYRIGQERKVVVHKFVCPGTVEERIDKLISEKKELAAEIIGGQAGAESVLTRMSDEELLRFVTLDLNSATI